MSSLKAREGQWYSNRLTRDTFCVIGVDEEGGLIDVRDGYGDIDEFDLQEWESMDLELCTGPRRRRGEWAVPDELEDDDDDDDEFPLSRAGPAYEAEHVTASPSSSQRPDRRRIE